MRHNYTNRLALLFLAALVLNLGNCGMRGVDLDPESKDFYEYARPYDLEPGEYYFDVIVIVQPKIGKVRKIFKIKD